MAPITQFEVSFDVKESDNKGYVNGTISGDFYIKPSYMVVNESQIENVSGSFQFNLPD